MAASIKGMTFQYISSINKRAVEILSQQEGTLQTFRLPLRLLNCYTQIYHVSHGKFGVFLVCEYVIQSCR